MDAREYQHFVSLFDSLTKEQMTNARHRLSHLIGNASTGQQSDWILDGILTVLQERGLGETIPPHFAIRKTKSFSGYETQADRVRRLLDNAMPDMSLTEHKLMGILAARSLADYISSWSEDNNEVTLARLLQHVSQIPTALNRAFPGYIESGVLTFLLRRQRD